MATNGHSKLTKAERKKVIDREERKKYDRTHKQKEGRKGNKRAGAVKGARLAYDALTKKKK